MGLLLKCVRLETEIEAGAIREHQGPRPLGNYQQLGPSPSPDPFRKHPYERLSKVLIVTLARVTSSATPTKLYNPDGNFCLANWVTA